MKKLQKLGKKILILLSVEFDIGLPTFPETRISAVRKIDEQRYQVECRCMQDGAIAWHMVIVSKEECENLWIGKHEFLVKSYVPSLAGHRMLSHCISPQPVTLQEYKLLEDEAQRIRLQV